MKTLLVGDCDPDRAFRLSDPDAYSEAEFEHTVVRALAWLYPRYHCILFGGTFLLDGVGSKRPDLALIAADLSHWFVIEVELTSHSLDHHVLPQVRAFIYGEPQRDCVSVIEQKLKIPRDRAGTLVHFVPRSVAVVANKRDETWATAFRALNAQMLVVSVFHSVKGGVALSVEGDLQAVSESIAFGTYSAVDRSCKFASNVRVPRGEIQLVDDSGVVATWEAVDGESSLWITKVLGIPDLPHRATVQLLRAYDGRLILKCPGRPAR